MKTLRGLYPQIIARENLYRAAERAARGKRYRDTTADFTFCLEEEVDHLHRELAAKTYRHGPYRMFTIYEPKARRVAAAPFRDRVVHHAAHDVVEPMVDRTFISDSYACRRGKGTHAAVDRAQRFARAYRWCLHGDIRKYFPSIDHAILKGLLRERIADPELLWLLDEVIDSAARAPDGAEGGASPWYGVKGLPIGNLTSQFFANLYLDQLDSFVKCELRAKGYLRYMDDFLLFGEERTRLAEAKDRIRAFLNSRLALNLHEGKSQIHATRGGVTFLGFRIFASHRRLVSANVRRLRKRLRRFARVFERGKIEAAKVRDSLRCWVSHSRYAASARLRVRIAEEVRRRDARFGEAVGDVLLASTAEGRRS